MEHIVKYGYKVSVGLYSALVLLGMIHIGSHVTDYVWTVNSLINLSLLIVILYLFIGIMGICMSSEKLTVQFFVIVVPFGVCSVIGMLGTIDFVIEQHSHVVGMVFSIMLGASIGLFLFKRILEEWQFYCEMRGQ